MAPKQSKTSKKPDKKPDKKPAKKSRAAKIATFDFASLQRRIVAASKRAFRDMAKLSPKDPICSFALYSDDGAMTVCPAFDTASARAARLAADPHLSNKYCPPEWSHEMVGGDREFDAICSTVADHVLALERGFPAFRKALFETCLCALDELREAGQFDTSPPLLVMFDVSDADLSKATQIAWMRRLNPGSPLVAEFRRWTAEWAR